LFHTWSAVLHVVQSSAEVQSSHEASHGSQSLLSPVK